MSKTTRYALTVMCEDKVGLVANLTRTIKEEGGNIEELYQGVLQGYFVITMMANFGNGLSAEEVEQAIQKLGEKDNFIVSILPRREEALPPAATGISFVLTVSGHDESGILHKITSYLADRRANIEDLSSQTTGERFTITAHLTVPEETSITALRLDLSEILDPSRTTVNIMHEDIFKATSRVAM